MAKRTMPKQKPHRSIQSVGTPKEFILAAARKLGIKEFVFDLAADAHNAICPEFYDESDDALDPSVSWNQYDRWSWLNPPFGKIGPWVKKACDEATNGAHVAVLAPASVGANWWKKYVDRIARILFLNGRITFVGHQIPYPKDCALLLYGPNEQLGTEVWSWQDELTEEEKQMAKKRIGKAKTFWKPTTKAGKKAAAKAPKVRAIREGKKRGRPKKRETVGDVIRQQEAARVTTFTPNAPASVSSIPEPSAVDLGPVIVPDPESSQKLLKELAQLNDRALDAQARYAALKEATKNAKERYDDLAEQVITRLRQATHASDLPLFADVEKREQDQKAMEAGAQAIPQTDADVAAEGRTAVAGLPEAHEPMPGEESIGPAAPDAPTGTPEPSLAVPEDCPF